METSRRSKRMVTAQNGRSDWKLKGEDDDSDVKQLHTLLPAPRCPLASQICLPLRADFIPLLQASVFVFS